MIHINKSIITLSNDIIAKHIREYIKLKKIQRTGKIQKSDFNESLYKITAIKNTLWNDQHHKCCYCESQLQLQYSDVEHFRPKTRAINSDKSYDPGYWWLAYCYDNLLYSCNTCNRTHKKDKFPLMPHGIRLIYPQKSPKNGQASELNLIINPATEDPSDHLTFVYDQHGEPRITWKTLRGETTIKAIGLNSDSMHILRLQYFTEYIKPIIDNYALAKNNNDLLKQELYRTNAIDLCSDGKFYALLSRSILKYHGII